MTQTFLHKAVAMALTGTALSMAGISTASANATTMYNLYRANFAGYTDPNNPDGPAGAIFTPTSTIPCSPCSNLSTDPIGPDNGTGNSTDGWVWAPNPDGPNTSQPFNLTAATASASRPGWVGIGGSSTPTQTTPFGYNARVTLNWAVDFAGGTSNSAEISNADAISRYTQSADIDTAQGAWSDNNASGASGWKHDLDWGLFKSDVSGLVTITTQGVNESGRNYGYTIFKGMSPNVNGAYSHHGAWNNNGNNTGGAPTTTNIPGNTGFVLGDLEAWTVGGASPQNLTTITFNAVAGQIYSIAVGGYRNGSNMTTSDGYKLTISQQTPVPIPAAVWLFGSALAALGVVGRRKGRADS